MCRKRLSDRRRKWHGAIGARCLRSAERDTTGRRSRDLEIDADSSSEEVDSVEAQAEELAGPEPGACTGDYKSPVPRVDRCRDGENLVDGEDLESGGRRDRWPADAEQGLAAMTLSRAAARKTAPTRP